MTIVVADKSFELVVDDVCFRIEVLHYTVDVNRLCELELKLSFFLGSRDLV